MPLLLVPLVSLLVPFFLPPFTREEKKMFQVLHLGPPAPPSIALAMLSQARGIPKLKLPLVSKRRRSNEERKRRVALNEGSGSQVISPVILSLQSFFQIP